jgi:hypothetical protein
VIFSRPACRVSMPAPSTDTTLARLLMRGTKTLSPGRGDHPARSCCCSAFLSCGAGREGSRRRLEGAARAHPECAQATCRHQSSPAQPPAPAAPALPPSPPPRRPPLPPAARPPAGAALSSLRALQRPQLRPFATAGWPLAPPAHACSSQGRKRAQQTGGRGW